jgi:indolepyruvate ferredoxin oxidoreductase alpha subunit
VDKIFRKLIDVSEGYALLLGNEAVARGALEAGVEVATAYPGTPSSEIIGSLMEVADLLNIYVEWSVNEKVAFELAWAAALSNKKSITAMKHVGLNVAADALMSSAYTGVSESFVIVSADDPSMWSSQNEQDNRLYSHISYIPVFEPSDPGEAKDLTVKLFDLSSMIKHPMMLRMTTRLSHVRGPVRLGRVERKTSKALFRPEPRYVLVPSNARVNRIDLLKRWEKIKDVINDLEFNKVFGDGKILIIAPGLAFSYVYEIVSKHDLLNKTRVLKLSSINPLPEKIVIEEAVKSEKIIVVEELEPVVENEIRILLNREKINVEVLGKNFVDRAYELTLERVEKIIEELTGLIKISVNIDKEIKKPYIPPRPPVFCPGCPYRPLFYEMRKIISRERLKTVISGDIGCYSLSYYPPYKIQDTIVEMGGSIGLGNGFSTVLKDHVIISVIGDSTFFHAGIPALINSIYNDHPQIVIILDNMSTAMTGHQPSPSTPRDERKILIEDLVKSIGVKNVFVIDPFDVDSFNKAFHEAIKNLREKHETSVIIARRKCALIAYADMIRDGVEIYPYYVDPEICVGCGLCYNLFACPAITPLENRKAFIDPELCIGCGSCVVSCPYNAIKPLKPFDRKALDKYWF